MEEVASMQCHIANALSAVGPSSHSHIDPQAVISKARNGGRTLATHGASEGQGHNSPCCESMLRGWLQCCTEV
eukprot:3859628-Amphidinium_carterae.1